MYPLGDDRCVCVGAHSAYFRVETAQTSNKDVGQQPSESEYIIHPEAVCHPEVLGTHLGWRLWYCPGWLCAEGFLGLTLVLMALFLVPWLTTVLGSK